MHFKQNEFDPLWIWEPMNMIINLKSVSSDKTLWNDSNKAI